MVPYKESGHTGFFTSIEIVLSKKYKFELSARSDFDWPKKGFS